MKLLSSLPEY